MAELLIADLKSISPQTPQTQALIQAVEEDKCFFSADFSAFLVFMLALQKANCPEIAEKFAHRVYHQQDKQYMAENSRAISIAESDLVKRVSGPANTLPVATSSSTVVDSAQESSEVIKKISARFPPLENLADDPEKKLQTALGFLKLFDMDFGITQNQTDDDDDDDDDDD